ncbi:hypothetical protein HJG60_010961 [Phyllostomus discolor]|uniref:Uncharacterized protein n=1 Tax=Phyllostomus discolor TaxID=89673 RepID=A0A834A7Z3_9CHIR|nr:hypothetical protein HJG60_010961 [Phyllostomus discolor]
MLQITVNPSLARGPHSGPIHGQHPWACLYPESHPPVTSISVDCRLPNTDFFQLPLSSPPAIAPKIHHLFQGSSHLPLRPHFPVYWAQISHPKGPQIPATLRAYHMLTGTDDQFAPSLLSSNPGTHPPLHSQLMTLPPTSPDNRSHGKKTP